MNKILVMKNKKGNENAITLISLVITIVILLILATIGISTGIETINSSKLTKFNTEMKIMQLKANEWYDEYNQATNDEEKQEIINRGESIVSGEGQTDVVTQADKVFTLEESGIIFDDTQKREDYRYYSNKKLKELGVEGVEQDFFVNVKNRMIVSYEGLSYKGEMYYTISQLPQMDIYNVDYEANSGAPTFKVRFSEMEKNKRWKIEVYDIQYEDGYINKWNVKYRIKGEENWKTSTNLEFEVSEQGIYEIMIENNEIYSNDPPIEIAIEGEVKIGRDFTDKNGNEWIWIEVPKNIYNDTNYNDNGNKKPANSEDYGNIEYVMQQYAATYRDSDNKGTKAGTDEWYDSNGKTKDEGGNVEDTKGCGLTYKEYTELKQKMLKSVYENGGFYIGKYEVGIKGDSFRDYGTDFYTEHPIEEIPVIQKNKYVYNWVTTFQAQELSEKLTIGGKETSLMFGIQWDLVMKYIEIKKPTFGDMNQTAEHKLKIDSSSWGNYSNINFTITNTDAKYSENNGANYNSVTTEGYTKQINESRLFTTGATERNSVLGIYDLSGNAYERTLERLNDNNLNCITRGGNFSDGNGGGNAYPASSRGAGGILSSDYAAGFRTALY